MRRLSVTSLDQPQDQPQDQLQPPRHDSQVSHGELAWLGREGRGPGQCEEQSKTQEEGEMAGHSQDLEVHGRRRQAPHTRGSAHGEGPEELHRG